MTIINAMAVTDKDDISVCITHKAYELSTEDEERLGDLFKKLDSNGDGKIDVADLSKGLKLLKLPHIPGQMEVCYIFVFKFYISLNILIATVVCIGLFHSSLEICLMSGHPGYD